MNTEEYISERIDCKAVQRVELVQSLWSGYGEIVRYKLDGEKCPATIIVKSVSPPTESSHPKGWDTQHSHNRKLLSYRVEANWYRDWAFQCNAPAFVPECFGILDENCDHTSKADTKTEQLSEQCLILLSDLDESGFMVRKQSLTTEQSKVCITWLAYFHAQFLQDSPDKSWPSGLWPIGSYWHLGTRADEYEVMPDSPLKRAAIEIDQKLNSCRFKTLVHGDAKVANFCFSQNGDRVAAVDFQYVGAGCGMKDLIYFIGSCLTQEQCRQEFEELIEHYFSELSVALKLNHSSIDYDMVEREWRPLFFVAWADFQRFILGWSPGHAKNNSFSQEMTKIALESLVSYAVKK